MTESIIDSRTARLIIRSKLPIIIPSILIGTFGGLFYIEDDISLDPTIIYGILAPMTLLIGMGCAMIGAKLSTSKLFGSKFQLTTEELTLRKNEGKTSIRLSEIKSCSENSFGLKIRGSGSSIFIPKQVVNYAEFRKQLMNKDA